MLKVHGKCVHWGDCNCYVGKESDKYEDVHEWFGHGQKNVDGERVLEFVDSFKLKIVNTWFKKDVEKLVTYESGGHKTVIDYILVKKEVKNVKATPDEEVIMQHRLIVMNILFKKACRAKSENKSNQV